MSAPFRAVALLALVASTCALTVSSNRRTSRLRRRPRPVLSLLEETVSTCDADSDSSAHAKPAATPALDAKAYLRMRGLHGEEAPLVIEEGPSSSKKAAVEIGTALLLVVPCLALVQLSAYDAALGPTGSPDNFAVYNLLATLASSVPWV